VATAGTGMFSSEASATVTSPVSILPGANISSTPEMASVVDWPSRIRASFVVLTTASRSAR
jgi:hypothetical protein